MKLIVAAVLLIGLSMVTTCGGGSAGTWLTANAQQPKALAAPGGEVSPAALPAETLLKIRDLQLADANRRLKMQALESDYQKLKDEQKADAARLTEIVAAVAKAAGVDLAKYVFDLDQSKFVPREKLAAPEKKPGEDKPQ